MYFILRVAFWMSIVILLIPTDKTIKPGVPAPRTLSTLEALGAVQMAYEDFRGICERKPLVCDAGGAAADTFSSKARNGARMVFNLFGHKDEDGPIGSIPSVHFRRDANGAEIMPEPRAKPVAANRVAIKQPSA